MCRTNNPELRVPFGFDVGRRAGDGLKPASGEICNAYKNVLRHTQCGNDAKDFMRNTLAAFIKPGMAV